MKKLAASILCAIAMSSCSAATNSLPVTRALTSSAAVVATAGPDTATPGAALPEPPNVYSVKGVATVSLIVRIDPATAMPELIYQGQSGVAPTIRVEPGDSIVVDVSNQLPANGGMASDFNLHFHGLTVSPNPPADDVITTLAMPGNTLHYVVPIPTTQQPGLYWYHPHVMGETNYQVGEAGMSGAIVIDGLQRHIPALASMKERLIVIRDVATAVANDATRVRVRPNDLDTNTNPCGPDPGLQVTLNGAVQPTIAIAPNEAQFFRIVNATGHKNLNLSIDGGTLEIVAIDGYALDVHRGTPPTLTVANYVLPPAARVEFVVRGTAGAAEFRSLCYNSGPTGDPDPEVILANLRATSAEKRDAARQRAVPARLAASGPLPAVVAPSAIAANRTVVFSEDANGFYINNQHFYMGAPPMFTVKAGTMEQWQVVNITEEVHDFHIHQVHFLVQQVNGSTVSAPHWADSVVVPARKPGANGSWTPGSLSVLVDFENPVIKGEFMFHCHILDHEDMGMMAKIRAI